MEIIMEIIFEFFAEIIGAIIESKKVSKTVRIILLMVLGIPVDALIIFGCVYCFRNENVVCGVILSISAVIVTVAILYITVGIVMGRKPFKKK